MGYFEDLAKKYNLSEEKITVEEKPSSSDDFFNNLAIKYNIPIEKKPPMASKVNFLLEGKATKAFDIVPEIETKATKIELPKVKTDYFEDLAKKYNLTDKKVEPAKPIENLEQRQEEIYKNKPWLRPVKSEPFIKTLGKEFINLSDKNYSSDIGKALLNAPKQFFTSPVFKGFSKSILEYVKPMEYLLNIPKKLIFPESKPTLENYNLEYKGFEEQIGRFAGEITKLSVLGIGTSSIVPTVLEKFGIPLFPTISWITAHAIEGGTKWGIKGIFDEIANQIETNKFSSIKLIKNFIKESSAGVALGISSSIPNKVGNVLSSALVLGGWTAFEKLIKNKQLTKKDIPDIAFNSALAAVMAIITTKQVSDAFKKWDTNTFWKNHLLNKLNGNEELANTFNKVEAVYSSNPANPIIKSLRAKLHAAFLYKIDRDYLIIQQGKSIKGTPSSLNELLTPSEKLLLEQISQIVNSVPSIPITLEKPAYFQEAVKPIDTLTNINKFLPKKTVKIEKISNIIPKDILNDLKIPSFQKTPSITPITNIPIKLLNPEISKHSLQDIGQMLEFKNQPTLGQKIKKIKLPDEIQNSSQLESIIKNNLTPEEQIIAEPYIKNRISQLKFQEQNPQDFLEMFIDKKEIKPEISLIGEKEITPQINILGDKGIIGISVGGKKIQVDNLNPALQNFIKGIEKRIPNPETIAKADVNELARIRDSMKALRAELKKTKFPEIKTTEITDKKIAKAMVRLEDETLLKIDKRVGQVIDNTEEHASANLWKKYKIPEGGYPEAVKGVEEVKPIPEELEPLTQKAREISKKYPNTPEGLRKGAEEFVKALDEGQAGLYVDYTPIKRLLESNTGKETLVDLGLKPNDTITVYRGIDDLSGKVKRKINIGDYVATSRELAESYTGNPKDVVSLKIKVKDFYTDIVSSGITKNDIKNGIENAHLEGVYNPNQPITKSLLTDFYNQVVKGVKEVKEGIDIKGEKEWQKYLSEEEVDLSFQGEMESSYLDFVDILKNPKLKNSKELLSSGDIEQVSDLLVKKGIYNSKAEANRLFQNNGDTGMTDFEVLNKYRERLMQTNPNLLLGKKVAQEAGIKSSQTRIDSFIENNYQKFLDEKRKENQAGFIDLSQIKLPKFNLDFLTDFEGIKSFGNSLIKEFNKFRFFPLLKNYPELKNKIRIEIIGGQKKMQTKVEKILNGIFGLLDKKELLDAITIIYAKNDIARINKGLVSENTIEEAQQILNDTLDISSEKSLIAAEQWKQLMEMYRQDLIDRGKLKPEQGIEDYAPIYVMDYLKDYSFNIGIPKSLKQPYRAYTKKAKGTLKESVKNIKGLSNYLYRVEMDNLVEDFTIKTLEEYDITNSLSLEDKKQYFGLNESGNINLRAKPNQIIEIKGKKYEGFQFEKGRYIFPISVDSESSVLALGRPKTTYLIPKEISETFNNFNPNINFPFLREINRIVSLFKSSAIFFSYIKYNVNNLFGDFVMLGLQYSKALSSIPNSLEYLTTKKFNFDVKQKAFNEYMVKQDVLGSTLVHAELLELEKSENPLKFILNKTQHLSQFREAILRTALAYSLWEDLTVKGIDRSKEINWINTKGLTPEDAIGKISREMIIDYLGTSFTFNRIVKGLILPFGTWPLKTTALIASYGAKHPFKLLYKLLIPLIALSLYNRLKHKKAEENLPDYLQKRTHLIISSNGDKAIVWTPQVLIDSIFGFPIINIALNNAFKAGYGQISWEKAAKQTLSEFGITTKESAEYLINPIYKFLKGIWSNTNQLTKTPILPKDGKIPLHQKWNYWFNYMSETLIPPMALYLRSQKRLEPSKPKPVEYIAEWVNPIKALGFYSINLTGKQEDIYNNINSLEVKRNGLLVNIIDDFVNQKLTSEKLNSYKEVAIKDGISITDEEINNTLSTPYVLREFLKEQLRNTADKIEREKIENKIKALGTKSLINRILSMPKELRKFLLQ